jgi:hypothetical protein
MTIKLRYRLLGHHVHVDVFAGEDADHLASCGSLVFLVGEWQLFSEALLLGAKLTSVTVLREGTLDPETPRSVA